MRRNIPAEAIINWAKDSDLDVRFVAMKACQSRTDVPAEVIIAGTKDLDLVVRKAAIQVCQSRTDVQLPALRTFEPPDRVWKKCLSGVLVCAAIPKDAEVRGAPGEKCRSSKAEILEVVGDVCGEPVGISAYDKNTFYYAGDKVRIQNFDFSDATCAPGFHFFCTREEAENYE